MNCIYKITNLINGLIYIGKTTDYKRRIKEYKYGSKTITRRKKYRVMEEIHKYGFSNFKFEIIENNIDFKNLDNREIFWIDKLNSRDTNVGYNSKTGGIGGELIDKSKIKMSESSKNFHHTEEEKLHRSKPIIVYHCGGLYETYSSAKEYSDIINRSRSEVTAAIKRGIEFENSFIFYKDVSLRELTKNIIIHDKECKNKKARIALLKYITAYEDLRI